jgi:putative membrane protein
MPATNELFRNLIAPAILASAGLLILFHKPCFNAKTIIIFSVIAILAFIVEALGVKTGNIFGQYSYGNNLGPAVAGTPLLISVNWLMLIYCSIIITDRISSNTSIRFLAPPFSGIDKVIFK